MIAIVYLVKATVVMLTAVMAVAFVRPRMSAGTRHFICTLAIGGLLALPIVSWALPDWTAISLPVILQAVDQRIVAETEETPAGWSAGVASATNPVSPLATRAGSNHPGLTFSVLPEIAWPVVLLVVYGTGVCLLLVRVAVHHVTAWRLLRRTTEMTGPEWRTLLRDCADQIGVRSPVRLLRHPDCMPPLAIGIRRAIVLPALAEGWSDEVRRAVLLHELAHVARRDCLTQAGAAFACALYWIHPGSWWLTRRLRIDRELACDDIVLSVGISAPDYAGHVLEVAFRCGTAAPALAVGMSTSSRLETRLLALLDGSRKRAALTSRARTAAVVICALLMVAIAAPGTHAAQPNEAVPAKVSAGADRRVHPEFVRRYLSVDYWHRLAVEQLKRVADQMHYLSEMRELGYSVADTPTLFSLRQHGVTPDYVRVLAAEGLSGLSTEELLAAVRQGITAGYVRDIKSLRYQPVDVESLITLRRHGIDGDFVRALDDVGFRQLPIEALLQARRHGISADYIGELHELGYGWSMDDLVRARSHGIDAEYVRTVAAQGHPRISLDDLVRLRSHGVTSARIQAANERAGTVVPLDQLIRLASHGWRE